MPDEQLMELAEQITAAYETAPGLSMALVTGSVARGLADRSSDLDVYLYWDRVDRESLGTSARGEQAGGTRAFSLPTATGYFEKYRFGDRLVDVESVAVQALMNIATRLDRREPMSTQTAKTMAGVRDAIAIRGADELARWQSHLRYSPEQGLVEVAVHLRQFLPPMAIHDVTLARGDSISYFSRLSAIALAAVGAVAAINAYALPTTDPKWLPWHVARLAIQPPDFLSRLEGPFVQPDAVSIIGFANVLSETLDLIESEMPAAAPEVARARFVLAFR